MCPASEHAFACACCRVISFLLALASGRSTDKSSRVRLSSSYLKNKYRKLAVHYFLSFPKVFIHDSTQNSSACTTAVVSDALESHFSVSEMFWR